MFEVAREFLIPSLNSLKTLTVLSHRGNLTLTRKTGVDKMFTRFHVGVPYFIWGEKPSGYDLNCSYYSCLFTTVTTHNILFIC